MAKQLSRKQIAAGFGGSRRKAALRKRKPAAKKSRRHRNPPKGGGRVISGYGSTVMNRGKKKTNPGGSHKIVINRARKKSSHRKRTTARRKNPELVSFLLGNPARRKTVATSTKKKRKAASSRKNAGTRRSRPKKVAHHRHRRSNPAGINMQTIIYGSAGALGGSVGSAALAQMFLGGNNTGLPGYAATAGAGIALTILSHMLFKSKPAVVTGVAIGAGLNLLRRVIQDQTPFGPYISAPGMGDYMVANWGPPRMSDGLHSAMAEAPGTPWSGGGGMVMTSSGVSSQDLADMRTNRPC